MYKLIAIIVVIMFILAFGLPLLAIFNVDATTLSTAQNNTLAAQKALNEAKQKQKVAEDQRKKIDGELNTINTNLSAIQAKMDIIDNQLAQDNKAIDEANTQLQQKNDLFDKRVQFIYEQGTSSYLEILFAAKNISDFFYRYEIINQLLEYDKEIIDKVNAAKQTLVEKKLAIEQTKVLKEQELAVQVSQQKAYQGKQQESKAIYDKLSKDVKTFEQAYNAAEQQEEALKRQAAAALKGSTVKYSGEKFAWPVNGYYSITSPYGNRMHPTLKVNKFHTGTDISAPSGASVTAMNSGLVIMAGYNSAYGNYIIIDHGGGYSTLYGHASALCVSKGQTVTRGQLIMKVGSTGFSTGPHLHFEVLLNGTTTNPMSYF